MIEKEEKETNEEETNNNKDVLKYKQFTLDNFQVEAIKAIERNSSVVVSAATGTGKTLIADYAINKFQNLNKRVVYTAPIKALSNQKFRDFKKEYGEQAVGIMTGDVVINPEAHLLIMTTEIYRNMLLSNDEIIKTIGYVIFDEIHFMSDPERGTIWEESIIFSHEDTRFICLSATIPNAQEFADWISSILHHKVEVVSNHNRAVPLKHHIYDVEHGVLTIKEAVELKKSDMMPDYYKMMRGNKKKKKSKEKPKVPQHYDLVSTLKSEDQLPCIFFVFSRKGCEEKADELSQRQDFLTDDEKNRVIQVYNDVVKDEYKVLDSAKLVKRSLLKGIGVHHAGILPGLKEAVEILFSEGFVKVLYATETFAVGINMPARSVAFNSLVKYDGSGFNFMRTKEYFQMAGRAGRRGIDEMGYVYALLERRSELSKTIKLTESDSEPIISQFRLTPNTVLNMLNNHTEKEREVILKSNFDYFLKKKDEMNIRIKSRFNNLVKKLKKYNYVDENNKLTNKGLFGTRIYSNEFLITELFSGKLYKSLSDDEICVLIASIVYEHRRSDKFFRLKKNKRAYALAGKVVINNLEKQELNKLAIRDLWHVVTSWANGCSFEELMEMANYQEGDFIRLFRQMVDYMNQIRKATMDVELDERIVSCMNKVYRDIVRFEF